MSITQVQLSATPPTIAQRGSKGLVAQAQGLEAGGFNQENGLGEAGSPLSGSYPASAIWSRCGLIQPKLEIGAPDDAYEKEADAMADKVANNSLSMSEQYKGNSGSVRANASVQRKCDACEEEKPIQRKISTVPTSAVAERNIASSQVSNQIQNTRGSGQRLDGQTRAHMEHNIGHDFSQVRIHTGDYSAQMSRELNAKAFTVGKDIYFGAGHYQPQTKGGQQLIAHELTHTIQQAQAPAQSIQRAPDPRMYDTALNKRFADGTLTWEDTKNPFVIDRLSKMSLDELKAYLPKLKEQAAINLVKDIIDYKIVPAAANIKNDQPKVLPADQAMYDALTTYIVALPARINALIKSPPKDKEWIQNNPNVDEVVKIISQLGNDFTSKKYVVRFDPTLTGITMASYSQQGDTIRLRPSTDAQQIAKTTASLVHEFTHHLQDQAAEDEVMLTKKKKEMLKADDLKHEVEARKTGAYASALIYLLGDAKDPDNELFTGTMFLDNVMASRFESIRTAKTAGEKAAATKVVTDMVSKAYTESGQFARNTPSVTYYAEVGKYDNHVYLYVGAKKVDLGEVPSTMDTTSKLESYLGAKIKAGPNSYGVFDKPEAKGTSKYVIAGILLFYNGTKLADFAIAP